MSEPRVVLFDLETAPNIIAKFSLREEYIRPENILQERFVICASWKMLGEKRTHAVSLLDDRARFKTNVADDRHVVETIHKVLTGADVVVGHNSDRFDLRWVSGRALKHGLPPLPPVTSIDTLKIARKVFCLNSNRLDYLGKYLGLGGKTNTPPGLWLDALKGDPKAIREMVAYNKRDVELLEDVFYNLRPFMPNHYNRRLYVGDDRTCPRCGSDDVQARGWRTADTRVYQRFQCQAEGCGGWFKSNKAEKERKSSVRVL